MTSLRSLLTRFHRPVATAVVAVVVCGAFVAVVVGRNPVTNYGAGLEPGTAWFASASTGSAALLDAPTEVRADFLPSVAPAGHVLTTVQAGAGAYVVDHTAGTVTHIDGAELAAGSPVPFPGPNDATLQVLSTGSSTWVVRDHGAAVQQVDPTTLAEKGQPVTALAPFGGVALAPDGVLWTADAAGNVRSYENEVLRSQTNIGALGALQLVIQGDTPVLVSKADQAVLVLDPGSGQVTRSVALDIPDHGPWIAGGSQGSPNSIVVVSDPSSFAQIVDVVTGHSTSASLGVPEHHYGTPVVSGGDIFVPDLTTGSVIVLDAGSGKLIGAPINLELHGQTFDLTVCHGYAWFDVPTGDQAGVIVDDKAIAISKGQGGPQGSRIVPSTSSNGNSNTSAN